MRPIARISSTKFNRKNGFTLGVNIWLQLGWASPGEVTKNLARLSSLITNLKIVTSTIGHGVIRIPKIKKMKLETKIMYKKNLASKKHHEK